MRHRRESILSIAKNYVGAGLSVIPIRADGTKKPLGRWKNRQKKAPTDEELRRDFGGLQSVGIAIVAGKVSGNLEILDFDDPDALTAWRKLVPTSLLKKLPQVRTPKGGRHVYYRCSVIEGNQKLAQSKEKRTLIETRGEGGYCLAPGSSPKCHETGRPYLLTHGPSLPNIPTIKLSERNILLNAARQLNQVPVIVRGLTELPADMSRPGDDFNRKATWDDVLVRHGWMCVQEQAGERFWRRPGKNRSHSATTGFCNNGDTDLLHVFSSNAAPFEPGKSYSKFAAYALLNHGGDFRAAAKELGSKGTDSDSEAIMRRLSDIEPQQVEWLWRGVLAAGKLTLVSGHPGQGKSLITIDIAARVTTGRAFPGEQTTSTPGTVIALSAEDDAADTIRPRFDKAGGDATKFVVVEGTRRKGQESFFDLGRDVGALERALDDNPDCRVVIVDPISAYIGDVDAHKNAAVRQLLRPLADLAVRKRVAILLVDHRNKKDVGSAVTRSQGSIAFIAASRIAFLVAEDPSTPNQRLFVPIKNNLHQDKTGWRYSINEGPILIWGTERVEISAQDALDASPMKLSPRADAKEWLRQTLVQRPMPSKEVYSLADVAGHAQATIRRAKTELGILSRKGKGSKTAGFVWSLPTTDSVEQLEQVEHLEPAGKRPWQKRRRISTRSSSSTRSTRPRHRSINSVPRKAGGR